MFGILTCLWCCCFGGDEHTHRPDVNLQQKTSNPIVTEPPKERVGSFDTVDLDKQDVTVDYEEFENARRSTDSENKE